MGLVLDLLFPLPSASARPFARVVVAEDGTPLTAFADRNGIWRYPITLEEVAPAYLEALFTYEDRWFWYHPGVNPLSMLRAGQQYLRANRVLSGGSTLTMRVARILEPMPRRNLASKTRQVLRALQLEIHYSKREILTLYLNFAPFGGTLEGLQAASYTYFGKPANRLSDAEAALLAVLPQAPTRYRPDINPLVARAARDKLLQRMEKLQVWSAERVAQAKLEVVAAQRFASPSHAQLLSRRLSQIYTEQSLIRSSLDITLQQGLEDLTRAYVKRLPERTSAAVLVVDNRTQDVKAYLGSADFFSQARFGQIDMVQAIRSPGSTLKPFLYAMALDAGLVHSESLLTDAPTAFGNYRPQNFSSGFSGPVGLAEALRRSLNLPAVQVLDHLGVDVFVARLKNAGAQAVFAKGATPNLAVILGGFGTNLESLTQLYTALGRKGQAAPLNMIAQALNKNITPHEESQGRYLMSPGAAWIIGRILQGDHSAQSLNTPNRLPSPGALAWKTGTSYGYRDSWAIGVQGDYTLGVWIGRPDGTPLLGASGTVTAAPLLFSVAAQLETMFPYNRTSLAQPKNVSETEICWPLGAERSNVAEPLCHERRTAYILDGVAPPTLPDTGDTTWSTLQVKFRIDTASGLRIDDSCASDVTEERTLALWPQSLEPWLGEQQKRNKVIPAYHPNCKRPPELAVG
ncbi:MAG: penicillin-binding protein 1C, partial [Sphingobacteriales bacterium]